MNDIEKILGEMEAYVETHAKGWGPKDAAKDHLSQHALCYSATQYLPRLIAAVRVCEWRGVGNAMGYWAKGRYVQYVILHMRQAFRSSGRPHRQQRNHWNGV
jgi:hypothetical protein